MAAVVIAFSTALVAEPALRRVEPVRTSGPVGTTTVTSASLARPGPGVQVRRTVAAPRARAARSAAAEPRPFAPAAIGAVLRALVGAEDGLAPSRHHRADALGVGAKGRGALRRLQDAQAAGGAGAEEDDVAAAGPGACDERGRP